VFTKLAKGATVDLVPIVVKEDGLYLDMSRLRSPMLTTFSGPVGFAATAEDAPGAPAVPAWASQEEEDWWRENRHDLGTLSAEEGHLFDPNARANVFTMDSGFAEIPVNAMQGGPGGELRERGDHRPRTAVERLADDALEARYEATRPAHWDRIPSMGAEAEGEEAAERAEHALLHELLKGEVEETEFSTTARFGILNRLARKRYNSLTEEDRLITVARRTNRRREAAGGLVHVYDCLRDLYEADLGDLDDDDDDLDDEAPDEGAVGDPPPEA